jgi:hypothetical protein
MSIAAPILTPLSAEPAGPGAMAPIDDAPYPDRAPGRAGEKDTP